FDPAQALAMGDDADLHAFGLEDRALLDMELEEGVHLARTHGQGLRWIECTVTGKESHTGSTPMPMRRNAGRGLAQITELVHEIAMSHQPNAVGAIGHIDVHPNSRNIIPGKVVFTADFRSHIMETLQAMVDRFDAEAPKLCEALGVEFESRIVGSFDPPAFDEGCVGAIRGAAEKMGYSHRNIVSGAGHDACWINRVAPTAMVMCPCVDGLSHNEAEEITPEWAEKGTNVLLHAVLDSAEIME
ncbi:MAG: M20/M25/M40 family metallo-hydrolase, partial [Pseudomonadota bacterium]